MAQLLINVVFKILNFIADLFLSPIFSAISTVLPSVSTFFSSILSFLNLIFTYMNFIVNFVMIPKSLLITFVGLWVGIFAFNLTIRTFGLGMAIYHWFKP